MDVERKRAADWPHWPSRGSSSSRRTRLERRLFRDSEREAEIAQAQEAVRQIEQATAAKAAEIERLELAVGGIAEPAVEPEPAGDYVLFAWAPKGYALHEGHGVTPAVGTRLQVGGQDYAVVKLAGSPLPGDERRCAYLDPL